MFQRQLRRLEPFAVCFRPPPDNWSALWRSSRKISDAFRSHSRNYDWNAGRSSSGRCASRSRYGSGFDGVGHGMVCRVPVVLDRGEAKVHADRDRAGDRRLLAAFPDESPARIAPALFTRRVDRILHLGRPRARPACPELECKTIRGASATTTETSAFKSE